MRLWNNYRLFFTGDWAVGIDWHVVIIWLCTYREASPTRSASQCRWTKKIIIWFRKKNTWQCKKKKDSGVPTVNLVRLMSFSKEKSSCYLPHDWPRLQNKCHTLCHKMFLHIHRQRSFRNFQPVLRATLLVTVGSWFFNHLTRVQIISVAPLASINNYPRYFNILKAFWTLSRQICAASWWIMVNSKGTVIKLYCSAFLLLPFVWTVGPVSV